MRLVTHDTILGLASGLFGVPSGLSRDMRKISSQWPVGLDQ